jgi:alpha-tubulin suppressor-like RCC1 family protein
LSLIGEAGRWLATALTGLFCKKQGAEVSKNLVVKTLSDGETWTCPAGVTSVQLAGLINVENIDELAVRGIDNDLKYYSWGNNSAGNLGDTTTTSRSFPQVMPYNLNLKEFYTPVRHLFSFAKDAEGRLYGWGANTYGNLGIGNTSNTTRPTEVLGITNVKKVYGGLISSFFIDGNDDLYGCGANLTGSLGDNTNTARSSPTPVLGGLKWKDVKAYGSTTYGLTTNNLIYSFGANSDGMLGDNTVTHRSSPVAVVGGKTWKTLARTEFNFEGWPQVTSLSSSYSLGSFSNTMLAIDENDDMYAWGNNGHGALGDGTTVRKSSPVLVVGGLKWKEAFTGSGGSTFTMASYGIDTNDNLYGWGSNTALAPLGDGTLTHRSSPVQILSNVAKFTRGYDFMQTGRAYCLALLKNGDLYAWGNNSTGQLGDGTTTAKSSPVLVSGGHKFITIFQASHYNGTTTFSFSGGLTEDRQILTWGSNSSGLLGDGTASNRSTPGRLFGNYGWLSNQFVPTKPIVVSVTPGSSYAVSKKGSTAVFGDAKVSPAEKVIISYLA